jgi:hypothetical protein
VNEDFPPAFAHLREFAFHAAGRAWTSLGHFFVAQSILALAWATIVDFELVGKPFVLVAISLVGIVMGFQWTVLGTRMWHYHLEYVSQLKTLWQAFKVDVHGPGADSWNQIDAAIGKYWRKDNLPWSVRALSGNQSTLFLAPLFLAFVHLVMLEVIVWNFGAPGPYVAIAAGVVFAIGVARVWKICEPVLTTPYF